MIFSFLDSGIERKFANKEALLTRLFLNFQDGKVALHKVITAEPLNLDVAYGPVKRDSTTMLDIPKLHSIDLLSPEHNYLQEENGPQKLQAYLTVPCL